MKPDLTSEVNVTSHYERLYRFAISLTRRESDARDLAQETFERFLRNPDQLREPAKIKTWLFTTLYRLFLEQRRRADRFPHVNVEGLSLPVVDTDAARKIDGQAVVSALSQLEDPFRAVLVLFYMEDHSYREIAEILGMPIGTVMSRLSRGKSLLRALLADRSDKIIPLPLQAAS